MIAHAANAATLLVGIAHLGFWYLESVLWAKPQGRRIFGLSEKDAETTKNLALNQGFYNGALAIGLFWSLAVANEGARLMLLSIIVAMGVIGGLTAKKSILFIQALPAAVAFVLSSLSAG